MNPTQKLIEAAEASAEALETLAKSMEFPSGGESVLSADLKKRAAAVREAMRGLREAGEPVAFTPPMIEAVYAAWHGAGVDIAGGNWRRFVGMLPVSSSAAAPPSPAPQHSATIDDLRSEIVALHATEENLRAGLV